MGSFSIADMLNAKTKAEAMQIPSAHFRTEDISIKRMYRNKENHYNLDNIESLKSNIKTVGLRQNLEVIYAPCEEGDYRILSGERRWLALNMLVDEGYKEYEIVTCKVSCPQDEDMERLELMATNSYREKNNEDLLMEVKEATAAFRNLKERGQSVPGYDLKSGRIRDIVASFLGLSKTKVAQIECINNNLLERLKSLLKQDKIPFSVAYEAAGLKTELQVKVVRRYYENGKVTLKDIKEIKQEYEEKNIPGQIKMAIPAPDQEKKAEVQMPTFTMMQLEDEQTVTIKEAVDSVKTEVDNIKEKADTALPAKKEYAWGVRDSAEVKQEEPIQKQKEQREELEEAPVKDTGKSESSETSSLAEFDGIPGQWYKLSDNIVPFPFVPVLVATNILNNSIKVHEGIRCSDNTWMVANNTWNGGDTATGRKTTIVAWMQMPEYEGV